MIRTRARGCSSVAIALLAALVLACAGGGDELERALQSLTENDLAIMVLPQEELGNEFADLEVAEGSGFQDNDEEADDTVDPEDTGADLQQAGRINGYGLEYEDADLSALEAGEGILSVSTGPDLFRDAEAASAYLEKQVEDFRRFRGMEIEPGVTLDEVETFDVSLGDESMGISFRVSFGDVEAYSTGVVFRLGRLTAGAGVARADDADVKALAEDLAVALEKRIRGVLLGDITGTPVPVPQEDEEGAAPEGGPDLAAMALSLDDLPAGASIDREGYVRDEDTVASYEREFDLGLVSIGNSELIGLENDVDLYTSSREASGIFTGSQAIFTGESAPEVLAGFASEGAGFEVSNPRIESISLPDLGDGSFGIRFTYETPVGPFENIFIFVQVGRALGTLILSEQPGKAALSDVAPLTEAMTGRMESVLAATP